MEDLAWVMFVAWGGCLFVLTVTEPLWIDTKFGRFIQRCWDAVSDAAQWAILKVVRRG